MQPLFIFLAASNHLLLLRRGNASLAENEVTLLCDVLVPVFSPFSFGGHSKYLPTVMN